MLIHVEDGQKSVLMVAKPVENDYKIKTAFCQYIVFKKVSFLCRQVKTGALHTAASIYVCECFVRGRGKFCVLLKAGMWNTDCGLWNGKCGRLTIEKTSTTWNQTSPVSSVLENNALMRFFYDHSRRRRSKISTHGSETCRKRFQN